MPLRMLLSLAIAIGATCLVRATEPPARRTEVSIIGRAFHINGKPTYEGRTWKGHTIEGLLFNSRMVQGIFDDLNPKTRSRWAYPDTGTWDADRNTREFLAAMPEWKRHGLLAFTLNLQGGSPEGYSKDQPWHNSAFEADGSLRPDFMARLENIFDRADELGMVVILGYFYFGRVVPNENVVRTADFLLLHGNGASDPKQITEQIQKTKALAGDRVLPILYNEDDHFDFKKPRNNLVAAVEEYVSWGYFDFRMRGEGFDDGFQSVPVNWAISSPRKRAFFEKLREITGVGP